MHNPPFLESVPVSFPGIVYLTQASSSKPHNSPPFDNRMRESWDTFGVCRPGRSGADPKFLVNLEVSTWLKDFRRFTIVLVCYRLVVSWRTGNAAHCADRQPVSGHERRHPHVHTPQRRRVHRAQREGDVPTDFHLHGPHVQARQASKVCTWSVFTSTPLCLSHAPVLFAICCVCCSLLVSVTAVRSLYKGVSLALWKTERDESLVCWRIAVRVSLYSSGLVCGHRFARFHPPRCPQATLA